MHEIGCVALAVFAVPLFSTNPSRTPVTMVVTLGHHDGQPPPALTRENVIVREEIEPVFSFGFYPARKATFLDPIQALR